MTKLKPVPADNKGLPNLPKNVRNNMGYMRKGGAVKKNSGGVYMSPRKRMAGA
jgi:hypothetical protein|tara:strand:- start:2418 stop:2576 length:159 start_codon:yes stop_codon:yes gene_type:complete